MENVLVESNKGMELVAIGGEKDVLYYIEEYMGAEFAERAKRNLQSDYDELKDDYEFLKTEFGSYEESLEKLLHDTVSVLDEVVEDIRTARRLNKKKLLERLEKLRREIYNAL